MNDKELSKEFVLQELNLTEWEFDCFGLNYKYFRISDVGYGLDYYNNINLAYINLRWGKIPFKINYLFGNLYINNCGLRTFLRFPRYISGSCDCSNNSLIRMRYSPNRIDGDFNISNNPTLKTLERCTKYVGGNFIIIGLRLNEKSVYPSKIFGSVIQ